MNIRQDKGFTLLEMLVALAIAALIIGSVMGIISESLRYRFNLREKAFIQPILESAAQEILADPSKAVEGVVRLTEMEGAPEVAVFLVPVHLSEELAGGGKAGQLCRVKLVYLSGTLEFSVIVPNQQ